MIERARIDCEPGTAVFHVWQNGTGEHRWLYRVVGLAWEARAGGWRVVCEDASDGPDRGRLLIFTADTFARSFEPAEPDAPAAPPAPEPEPEKVAGQYHQGSGV